MHVVVFLIATLLIGVSSSDDSLESIIKSIFNTDQDSLPNGQTTERPPPFDNKATQSNKSCGPQMKCVREYFCSKGNRNTDGATIINVRFDSDIPNSCPFSEICCSNEDIVADPFLRFEETPSTCGYRNANGVGFKIEGATSEAEFGEFPWMVVILRGSDDYDLVRNIYRCGGSLIHPKVVLTGAHCVYGSPATAFKARAGEWDTNSKTEIQPEQDRLVADMVIHEKYNNANLQNDIALLFLESPFNVLPTVNSICLPPTNYNFDFSRCFATGWGKDKYQNGKYQNILKKIDLPVVPNYQCQDNLRETRLGKYFELNPSFICAGGERDKDTCKGDGGSPLVCPIPNSSERYYQAGIVAWGIECGKENVPGVYGNVAMFRSWIDKQFAARGINTTSYEYVA